MSLSNLKVHISNSLTTVALSALQHYLYCPRQCALIHVERVWADSFSTAEGNALLEKAHSGQGESRPGMRIARGLKLDVITLTDRISRRAFTGVRGLK
jgi:hypothetical protein